MSAARLRFAGKATAWRQVLACEPDPASPAATLPEARAWLASGSLPVRVLLESAMGPEAHALVMAPSGELLWIPAAALDRPEGEAQAWWSVPAEALGSRVEIEWEPLVFSDDEAGATWAQVRLEGELVFFRRWDEAAGAPVGPVLRASAFDVVEKWESLEAGAEVAGGAGEPRPVVLLDGEAPSSAEQISRFLRLDMEGTSRALPAPSAMDALFAWRQLGPGEGAVVPAASPDMALPVPSVAGTPPGVVEPIDAPLARVAPPAGATSANVASPSAALATPASMISSSAALRDGAPPANRASPSAVPSAGAMPAGVMPPGAALRDGATPRNRALPSAVPPAGAPPAGVVPPSASLRDGAAPAGVVPLGASLRDGAPRAGVVSPGASLRDGATPAGVMPPSAALRDSATPAGMVPPGASLRDGATSASRTSPSAALRDGVTLASTVSPAAALPAGVAPPSIAPSVSVRTVDVTPSRHVSPIAAPPASGALPRDASPVAASKSDVTPPIVAPPAAVSSVGVTPVARRTVDVPPARDVSPVAARPSQATSPSTAKLPAAPAGVIPPLGDVRTPPLTPSAVAPPPAVPPSPSLSGKPRARAPEAALIALPTPAPRIVSHPVAPEAPAAGQPPRPAGPIALPDREVRMPAPAAPRAPPPTLLVRWADRGPHERVMADSLRNAQAAPLARVLHPLDPGRLAMLPPPPAAAAVVMGPPARPVIDRSIEIGEIVVELGHSAPGWRPAPPPPAGALMAAVPSLRVGGGRR